MLFFYYDPFEFRDIIERNIQLLILANLHLNYTKK